VKPHVWRKAIVESDLNATTKLVAHTLAFHMDYETGITFVGKQRLAEGAGLKSPRSVDLAINTLQGRGYLTIERKRGGSPNHYLATVPDPAGDAGLTPQEMQGFGHTNPASDDSEPRRRCPRTRS
jgi:hypothetical protein